MTLDTVPSFAGVTVGMMVSGLSIGTSTPLPGAAGEGGAVANTISHSGVGQHRHHQLMSRGDTAALNDGALGDIPAGTTLTFSFRQRTPISCRPTGTVTSATGNPFTYDYEFNQSKIARADATWHDPIYGAAVPGADETYATAQNILPYYQSVAATATTPGYTGYVTGGWTGIGSGYPSAFGYMSPTQPGFGLYRSKHDLRLHGDPIPRQDRGAGRG